MAARQLFHSRRAVIDHVYQEQGSLPCPPRLKRNEETHHSSRPFVHHLDQSRLKLFPERVVLHLTRNLPLFHLVCDRVDDLEPFFQLVVDLRLACGLFNEDEYRQQRNGFFGGVVGENIFENELGKDEFVRRIDLAVSPALKAPGLLQGDRVY